MTALILDHLWQSTLILCLAALLTLLLRRNSAAARYWLWFTVSVKFLVPLSLLSALATGWNAVPTMSVLSASASDFGQRLSEPFIQTPAAPNPVAAPLALPAAHLSTVLLILWGLGCGAVLLSWLVRWRRIQRTVSSARPLSLDAPIPVRESSTPMEPGLVGMWNPVILLPAGLVRRLEQAQIRGILAHELCHYRRRDNLTAAIHMLVEALFWFYPPIWWLGARLVTERELACDESVLAAGNDAEICADSILKVCRLFKQSVMASAAGVSGGTLSRRVEQIMSSNRTLPVGPAKKLLITISIASALLGMVLFGGLSAPTAQARASDWATTTPAEHARLLAEQEQPQKEVPFNPADFDKFVGYYKSDYPVLFAHVYRSGDHFYTKLTANPPLEIFPESPTKFFLTVMAAQWTFVAGPDGEVSEAILHNQGNLRPWIRSSKAAADAFETALQQRIKAEKPSPGTEAAVRRQIVAVERTGHSLYVEMTPPLAAAAHEQEKLIETAFKRRGALESIRFSRVFPNGDDDYVATLAHGQTEVRVSPVSADGKIGALVFRDMP